MIVQISIVVCYKYIEKIISITSRSVDCLVIYFSTQCNRGWILGFMTGIPQRMVDNNLGPDRLAGPKALGLMTGIVKFE